MRHQGTAGRNKTPKNEKKENNQAKLDKNYRYEKNNVKTQEITKKARADLAMCMLCIMDIKKSHLPLGSFVINTSLDLCHGRSVKTTSSLKELSLGFSNRSTVDLASLPSPGGTPASQTALPSTSQFLSSGGTENKCCALPVGAKLWQSYCYCKMACSLSHGCVHCCDCKANSK